MLQEFLAWLSVCNRNLKFTEQISKVKVEFLDIWIQDKEGTLEVNLHVKLTARNTLLHFSSYHPNCQKDSIPFGQFLRLRRNHTAMTDFMYNGEILKSKLICRGYPKKLVSHALKRAKYYNREALLQPRVKSRDSE